MCQAHEIHMEKYPRWSFLRSKIEMSKSKIENAKIENSKNPRLLSEESAEHPTLPLRVRGRCPSNSKILGVPKGCSRTSTTTKFFRFFIRLNVKILFKFEYFRKLEQD